MQNNPVNITYGLNVDNKNAYGMMMYNRNRLIKAYLKVGMQQGGSGNSTSKMYSQFSGKRVIGIIEADFLQPTHNKQDFDFTPAYRSCIFKLAEGNSNGMIL